MTLVRLGLHLAFGSDPAVRARTLLLAVVGAVGAALVLGWLGGVALLRAQEARYEARQLHVAGGAGDAGLRVEVRDDSWRGVQYPVVWLQPLVPRPATPPGLPGELEADRWYLSPALARLAAAEPALAARFPAARVLGPDAVREPGELLAYRTVPSGRVLGPRAVAVDRFGGGTGGAGPAFAVGEPTAPTVVAFTTATAGLVGLPFLVLAGTVLGLRAPARRHRFRVLGALGLRVRGRLVLTAVETVAATAVTAVPVTLVGVLVAPRLTTVPLVGGSVTPGDLAVAPPAAVAGLAVLLATLALATACVDGTHRRPTRSGHRAAVPTWVRALPLAGGGALLGVPAFDGGATAVASWAGVLLVSAGVPLVLPVVAARVGRAVATSGGPAAFLAGRRLERSHAELLRPFAGLASALVVVPLALAWLAAARAPDAPARHDRDLQVAVVRGAVEQLDPASLRVGGAVVGPLTALDDAGRPPRVRLGIGCPDLRALGGFDGCTTAGADAASATRLARLLGAPGGVELTAPATGGADAVVVIGHRSPGFDPAVRAAVLNRGGAVSVLSDDDLVLRESPTVPWILAGLALLAGQSAAAVAVGLADRTVAARRSSATLRVLGATAAGIRVVHRTEFGLAFAVVVGTALPIAVAASAAWQAQNSVAPYPAGDVALLGLAAVVLALPGLLAVTAVPRDRRRGPGRAQRPGGGEVREPGSTVAAGRMPSSSSAR